MAERRVTPADVRAIEAELMLTVYDARRHARLQLLGRERAPVPSVEALALWQRARRERA